MNEHNLREYRERYQAVAAIEAEEQRLATIAERWQQLNAVWRLAIGLGLQLAHRHDDEEAVYLRWAKLKGA